MDSGLQVCQQNSSQTNSGNVIVLNNNDMMQQRTSLGGQQVLFKTQKSIKSKIFFFFRLFLKQVRHQHLIQPKVKFSKQLMDN